MKIPGITPWVVLGLNKRVSALDVLLSLLSFLSFLQKRSLLFTQTPDIVYIPLGNCSSHNAL